MNPCKPLRSTRWIETFCRNTMKLYIMKLKNCQRVQNYNTTATYTNDIVINNRLVTILSHNMVYDRPVAVTRGAFC